MSVDTASSEDVISALNELTDEIREAADVLLPAEATVILDALVLMGIEVNEPGTYESPNAELARIALIEPEAVIVAATLAMFIVF